MRTAVAAAVLFILAVPPFAPGMGAGTGGDGNGEAPAALQGWWSSWYRDTDRNGIDDILDALDQELHANIFIDYSRRPSASDLDALWAFGMGLHDARYIDTVALYDVRVGDLDRVTGLPGVAMVEYQPEYSPALDISVPSLRARPSGTYANDVWEMLGIRGNGSVVAVIDTGIDNRLHESLDDQDDNPSTSDPKLLGGYDCSGNIWFEGDPVDNDGHGTHVAGIAAGTGGSSHNYVGVAPAAGLVDIKVMNAWGTAPAGKVLEGMRWAIENRQRFDITVLSLSLGTTTTSDGNDAVSQMANQASRSGLCVVVAAGNDGPANTGLGAPAAADEAIAVGATDDRGTISRTDDNIAYYSSRGPREGDNDLNRTDELKPDLCAPGTNIMSALASTTAGYVSMSGTSMACPHVSGVCALMHEANGALDPREIKQVLKETAEARGTAYNASLDAKYSTAYGDGIVDAYGAVRRALDLRSGIWSGPGMLGGGAAAAYNITLNWTRTELTTGQDSLFFNATLPGSWGKPQNLRFSGGAAASTSVAYTVTTSGSSWLVQGWLNYTGIPGSPQNLTPTLSMDTFAPGVSQNSTYTFNARFLANGIAWSGVNCTVSVVPAGLLVPDLALGAGDLSFNPSGPSAGTNVTLSARVHNLGSAGANTEVAFYDGPPGAKTVLGRSQVSVPPGGSQSAILAWPASAGQHHIYCRADPDNRTRETSEANNEASMILEVAGSNQRPTAVLNISASGAKSGESLFFDGSASSDPDGTVVLYKFEYGDGGSTGWTTDPQAGHSYSAGGIFTVTLTVQDNGAGEDDQSGMVDITETVKKAFRFHAYPNGSLDFLPPEGQPQTIGMPSSGEIGTWKAPAAGSELVMEGDCRLHLTVGNTGNASVSGITLELTVLNGTAVVNRTAVSGIAVSAQANSDVSASLVLPRTVLPGGSGLGIVVKASGGRQGTVLLVGGDPSALWISPTFIDPPPMPPSVSAGPSVTGKVGQPVQLRGRAVDPDGTVVLYEWDTDGDGTYDVSGASGAVDHVYPSAGSFKASLRVRDDSWAVAASSTSVVVMERNRAPVIRAVSPESPAAVTAGQAAAFRVQASDVDGDILTYSWSLDNGALPEATGDTFLFRSDALGRHTLVVVVSDGTASQTHGWDVIVERRNTGPELRAREPPGDTVSMPEGGSMRFSVTVYDADGDRLSYKWLLDGTEVGTVADYTYSPDFYSAGDHRLEVSASDGSANASAVWALAVGNVDRPPKATVVSPADGTVVSYGMELLFESRAQDPDKDTLEYSWVSDRSGLIGRASSFSATLPPGTHKIKLTVSDGLEETVVELTVTVKDRPGEGSGSTPGFEALALAPAALLAAMACVRRRARRWQ